MALTRAQATAAILALARADAASEGIGLFEIGLLPSDGPPFELVDVGPCTLRLPTHGDRRRDDDLDLLGPELCVRVEDRVVAILLRDDIAEWCLEHLGTMAVVRVNAPPGFVLRGSPGDLMAFRLRWR